MMFSSMHVRPALPSAASVRRSLVTTALCTIQAQEFFLWSASVRLRNLLAGIAIFQIGMINACSMALRRPSRFLAAKRPGA